MFHLHDSSWGTASAQILLLLSFFAGAVHVLAPDHWMPISLASWQRRWRARRTLSFSLAALSFHLALGFALFLGLRSLLLSLDSHWLFPFAVALVVLAAGARALRFGRIRDVLRLGSNRIWSTFAVLSFLGPSESLIPIMIKAHHLGVGYLSAFMAFAAGTMLSGLVLIALGRFIWNQPLRLTQGMSWANQRRSVLPIALGVVVGLVFLLKL